MKLSKRLTQDDILVQSTSVAQSPKMGSLKGSQLGKKKGKKSKHAAAQNSVSLQPTMRATPAVKEALTPASDAKSLGGFRDYLDSRESGKRSRLEREHQDDMVIIKNQIEEETERIEKQRRGSKIRIQGQNTMEGEERYDAPVSNKKQNQSIGKRQRIKAAKRMRFGVTMYVEKDLTLAPLIEQAEEDMGPVYNHP